jgi:SAM-dependent methyltransferase
VTPDRRQHAEDEVHHPLFARIYMRLTERRNEEEEEHRVRLLAGLNGRVIEVGAGHGLNFPHYPPAVNEVLAVEPEPVLRERAIEAAAGSPLEITVMTGIADRLPAEDGAFDAAVASLVLCTVPDQAAALAELRRVLKPQGELRFYEHVVANKPGWRRFMRFSDATWWPRVSGGCHLGRETAASIESAGFRIESIDRFPFGPGKRPLIPHILGTARAPR